jgi:hypothetical protein
MFTTALLTAHYASTLGPCPSLSRACLSTDHHLPPLPSRPAAGRWKPYVVGDFAEGDARKYLEEILKRAGSSATLDDDAWAKVYEVWPSERSEAELWLFWCWLFRVTGLHSSGFMTSF